MTRNLLELFFLFSLNRVVSIFDSSDKNSTVIQIKAIVQPFLWCCSLPNILQNIPCRFFFFVLARRMKGMANDLWVPNLHLSKVSMTHQNMITTFPTPLPMPINGIFSANQPSWFLYEITNILNRNLQVKSRVSVETLSKKNSFRPEKLNRCLSWKWLHF